MGGKSALAVIGMARQVIGVSDESGVTIGQDLADMVIAGMADQDPDRASPGFSSKRGAKPLKCLLRTCVGKDRLFGMAVSGRDVEENIVPSFPAERRK